MEAARFHDKKKALILIGLVSVSLSLSLLLMETAEAGKVRTESEQAIKLHYIVATIKNEKTLENDFDRIIIPKIQQSIDQSLGNKLQNKIIKAETQVYRLNGTSNLIGIYPDLAISGDTLRTQKEFTIDRDILIDDLHTLMVTELQNMGLIIIECDIHKSTIHQDCNGDRVRAPPI